MVSLIASDSFKAACCREDRPRAGAAEVPGGLIGGGRELWRVPAGGSGNHHPAPGFGNPDRCAGGCDPAHDLPPIPGGWDGAGPAPHAAPDVFERARYDQLL